MKRSLMITAAALLFVSMVALPAVALAELGPSTAIQPGEQGTMQEGMEDSTSAAEHAEAVGDRNGAVGYGLAALAAAFAVGLCALGTGYAQGKIGTAGGGALAEKPELSGTMIILVAIPETAVIMGFVIAFVLLGKL